MLVFTFAALLIGLIVKPRNRGVAETSFATGELYVDSDIGFDLNIEERITPGFGAPDPCVRAVFTIEGLPSERYHVSYNSSAYSTFLATTVPLKPGVKFTRYFPT